MKKYLEMQGELETKSSEPDEPGICPMPTIDMFTNSQIQAYAEQQGIWPTINDFTNSQLQNECEKRNIWPPPCPPIKVLSDFTNDEIVSYLSTQGINVNSDKYALTNETIIIDKSSDNTVTCNFAKLKEKSHYPTAVMFLLHRVHHDSDVNYITKFTYLDTSGRTSSKSFKESDKCGGFHAKEFTISQYSTERTFASITICKIFRRDTGEILGNLPLNILNIIYGQGINPKEPLVIDWKGSHFETCISFDCYTIYTVQPEKKIEGASKKRRAPKV